MILDNLSSHKTPRVAQPFNKVGAWLLFDMSPKFLPSFGEVLGFGLMALRCDPVQVYLLCKFQWGHVSQR